jgi:hypothetical protein
LVLLAIKYAAWAPIHFQCIHSAVQPVWFMNIALSNRTIIFFPLHASCYIIIAIPCSSILRKPFKVQLYVTNVMNFYVYVYTKQIKKSKWEISSGSINQSLFINSDHTTQTQWHLLWMNNSATTDISCI